jgi:hypothetical protein
LLALVALVLAGAVSMSLARTLLLRYERLPARLEKHQAELLALAALDRAARQLQTDPAATSLSWEVGFPDPKRRGIASVRIATGGSAEERLVRVAAELRDETGRLVQTELEQRMRIVAALQK